MCGSSCYDCLIDEVGDPTHCAEGMGSFPPKTNVYMRLAEHRSAQTELHGVANDMHCAESSAVIRLKARADCLAVSRRARGASDSAGGTLSSTGIIAYTKQLTPPMLYPM
ncbi:hypothetical protein EVAR_102269_1 [Eumeta japonica]|uniref:Uncharacterized protein n=1 Tax=Eumeta variegata TaxID=151549 RepID=A0A4C1WGL7_EUMVA|nr:hypothetical protein EVAR_102269_1 [Eumeta japonica]